MVFNKTIRIVGGAPIVFLLINFSLWYHTNDVLENKLGPESPYFLLMRFTVAHMEIGLTK